MKVPPALLLSLCGMLNSQACASGILPGNKLTIDFTKAGEAEAKAAWAEQPDSSGTTGQQLGVTAKGLGWDGEPAGSREGWTQTKPVPFTPKERALRSLSLTVTLETTPHPAATKASLPYGRVYVRHSPDLKHWSSWQELRPEPPEPKSQEPQAALQQVFRGGVSVPSRDYAEFRKLRDEYAKLHEGDWMNDDAVVDWIVAKEPKFFDRVFPLIGYVEFLYETSFQGGQRLSKLTAESSMAVGGQFIPKLPGKQEWWHFKAP